MYHPNRPSSDEFDTSWHETPAAWEVPIAEMQASRPTLDQWLQFIARHPAAPYIGIAVIIVVCTLTVIMFNLNPGPYTCPNGDCPRPVPTAVPTPIANSQACPEPTDPAAIVCNVSEVIGNIAPLVIMTIVLFAGMTAALGVARHYFV